MHNLVLEVISFCVLVSLLVNQLHSFLPILRKLLLPQRLQLRLLLLVSQLRLLRQHPQLRHLLFVAQPFFELGYERIAGYNHGKGNVVYGCECVIFNNMLTGTL